MDSALYVVATPIGNLGDMVPRAVEILQSVQLIAAEDTRHSAPLLKHFRIETPMLAYHEHSGEQDLQQIERCMRDGGSVALISDAGTPLISDPGYRLLQLACQQGWRVIPVPGASAVTAALSVSGLPTDRFAFEGFLPARGGPRRARLEALKSASVTQVFYEAPHRVLACLRDMADILGEQREAVLVREMTKVFETVIRAPLGELLQRLLEDSNQCRGEIVLLVAGAPERETRIDADMEKALLLLAAELPPRKAAAIASGIFGLRKKLLYEFLLNR